MRKSHCTTVPSTSKCKVNLIHTRLFRVDSERFTFHPTLTMDTLKNSNFSLWSKTNFFLYYAWCRKELFVSANGTRLLQLQNTDDMQVLDEMCKQTITMRHIFKIVPFVVGVPANVIALVALLTIRPRSIGLFYIALLATSDIGALVMSLVDYLLVDNGIDTPRLLCGLILTLISFFPCFANWMLVVVSFERYYTLRFPLHRAAHFTFGRAKLLAFSLGLLLFAYHLPSMFLVEESRYGYCPLVESLMVKISYNVLHFYAPVILTFTFVVLVVHCLSKEMYTHSSTESRSDASDRDRETNTSSGRDSHESIHRSGMSKRQSAPRMSTGELSVTIMMFCAATSFLFMTFPLMLMMYLEPDPMMGVAEMKFIFFLNLAQGFQSLRHVANFFLYVVACRHVRNHMFQMFRLQKLQRLCGCVDENRKTMTANEMAKAGEHSSDDYTNKE